MEDSDVLIQCPFDLLPDAVVVDILSRFSRSVLQDLRSKTSHPKGDCCEEFVRLQLVCKRWQGLLLHVSELGWKLRDAKDEKGLVKFLSRTPGFLKKLRLSLSTRYRASPELQGGLSRVCGSLQELETVQIRDPRAGPEQCASQPHFDYALLLNTFSQGKSIQSLTLTSSISIPQPPTLLPLPSLRHLYLTSAYITDNTLQNITDRCLNLESLRLEFVRGLQDTLIQSPPLQSFIILNGPYPESLSIDAPSLTHMELAVGEMLSIAAPQLKTLAIGSGLPELEVRQPWSVLILHLTGYYWMWDYIEALLRSCPSLVKLNIDVKNQLGPGESVPIRHFLWELCPQVEEIKLALGLLEIMDCSEEDLARCRAEDRLPLRSCVLEVDAVTECTLRQLEVFHGCAALESLQLVVLGSSRPAEAERGSGPLARLIALEEEWAVLRVVFMPACPGWTQWR
jgi:hypothetical protein